MSSHSHQRKQELLDTLAISRLEVLDGADELGAKIDNVLSFPGKIGTAMKNNPALLVTSAGVGGFLLFKLCSALLSHKHVKGRESSGIACTAKQGMIGVALTSVWGIVFSLIAPIVREKIEGMVRKKLGNVFPVKG